MARRAAARNELKPHDHRQIQSAKPLIISLGAGMRACSERDDQDRWNDTVIGQIRAHVWNLIKAELWLGGRQFSVLIIRITSALTG